MSVQLIGWAYGQRVGSPTVKMVLVTLANRANHDTGLCFPSVKLMADELECNEKTVRRAIEFLCDEGYISRERIRRDDGTLSVYRYRFPKVDIVAQPADPESASPADPESAQEPEVRSLTGVLAATPRNGRSNPIWNALTEVFGDATTETARSRRGKVCRSLLAAKATPDEIIRRARSWPRHFDDATLTELALEKHWDVLGRKPLRVTR